MSFIKRTLCPALAILISAGLLAGCNGNTVSSAPSSAAPSSSVSSESEPNQSVPSTSDTPNASADSEPVVAVPTQEELETLVAENFYCMRSVFSLGSLPVESYPESPVAAEDFICKVTSERFPDYASFEEYVCSVYCEKTADMYLKDYPYEGDPKYINRNGDLFVNLAYDGGKGYYADLENYTVVIGKSDGKTCDFSVETTIEEPADQPKTEPYTIEGKALYENGHWVLESMIS